VTEPLESDLGVGERSAAEQAGSEPRARGGGMVVLTLANALYIATAYAITVWLAHHLGPRDFGRYGVVTAIVTLVAIAVTRGVPVGATRAIAADPTTGRRTMTIAARVLVPVALAITAIAALLAVPIAAVLGDEQLRIPLLIGSVAALTYAAQALPLAWYTGRHRYGRQAVAQSWYAISRLGAIIAGGLVAGLEGAVAGFVLAPAIAALATLGGFRVRRDEADQQPEPSRDERPEVSPRQLLRDSVPLVVVAGLVSLLLTLDLLAFKRVGTSADAGRYAAAATIAHVPFFLLRSAAIVLMPAVAAALTFAGPGGAERSRRVRAEIRDGVGDAVVLLALPTALLVVLGDRALELIFGESYAVEGLVVAPLALATAAITLYSVFVAIETALGRLRVAVATGLVGAVLVTAAAAIGGQGSDVSRAAWAVAAAASLAALIHAGALWTRTGPFVPARALAAIPLAAAVAALTLLVPPGAGWFVLSATAACVVYGAIALRTNLVRLR
jgi:O-antigen/teichoic acid export membrane protein